MHKLETELDVTAAAGLGTPAKIAASVFLPPIEDVSDPPVIMLAVPGGSYSRGYFDMRFAGRPGYSQAEHHVSCGLVLVTMDHIGVGESTIPDLDAITFEMFAATYNSAARQMVEGLHHGTIAPGFPALGKPLTVGIGQSMGGAVTILTQGRYATFDAIAPLGISAIQNVLPTRDERDDPTKATPELLRFAFHWDTEPDELVRADMSGGYPQRKTVPLFGSATMPSCAYRLTLPGALAAEAAAVRTPVLIAMGERDVVPTPHQEPFAYANSPDVSLYVLPEMAHMHNFAPTRARLWDRIADWSLMLARERRD